MRNFQSEAKMKQIIAIVTTRSVSCFFLLPTKQLERQERVSDQMNRNHFDPILARPNLSCSTMENLTCHNFAVYDII